MSNESARSDEQSSSTVTSQYSTRGTPTSISYLLLEAQAFQSKENATARLYNNYLQVSEFLITVEARNEYGEVIKLPDNTQIDLIPFTSVRGTWTPKSGPHAKGYLPFDESFTLLETSSRESDALSSCTPPLTSSEEFLPAPAPDWRCSNAPDGEGVPRQVFSRYLSNDATAGGTVDRFAVRVRLANTEYRTNYPEAPYGGQGANGRFYSSVFLRSISHPNYTFGNGGVVETKENVRWHSETWYAFNHNIGLQLPASKRPIAIKHSAENLQASAYEAGVITNKVRGAIVTGMRSPEAPNTLLYSFPIGFPPDSIRWLKENGQIKPSPDQLVIVVSGLAAYSEPFSACGEYAFRFWDVYGNSKSISVSAKMQLPNDYRLIVADSV